MTKEKKPKKEKEPTPEELYAEAMTTYITEKINKPNTDKTPEQIEQDARRLIQLEAARNVAAIKGAGGTGEAGDYALTAQEIRELYG